MALGDAGRACRAADVTVVHVACGIDAGARAKRCPLRAARDAGVRPARGGRTERGPGVGIACVAACPAVFCRR
jgi:hypothetical protein